MKLLTLQLASTWFMTGVIWIVQVVHYPLFAQVGLDHFQAYEALHTKWITYVVAGPMLIELFASGAWTIERDRRISAWIPWMGAALVVVLWLATFAFSVRYHNELMGGFQQGAWRGLVATNWVRTIAWTTRGILLLYALNQALKWEKSANSLTSIGSSQNIPPDVGE